MAARLIDKASRWTAATLRERLRYHVLRANPDAAKKRQRQGVAQRRVYSQLHDDGTACLGGTNLPPDRAGHCHPRHLRRAAAADPSDPAAGRPEPYPPGTEPDPNGPEPHHEADPGDGYVAAGDAGDRLSRLLSPAQRAGTPSLRYAAER